VAHGGDFGGGFDGAEDVNLGLEWDRGKPWWEGVLDRFSERVGGLEIGVDSRGGAEERGEKRR